MPAQDAIDLLPEPCLYAHPGTLRILAVNAAAANDLERNRNELGQARLSDLFPSPTVPDLARRTSETGAPQGLPLTGQCCSHWSAAQLQVIGAGASHFIKVTVERKHSAPAVNTQVSNHDLVASNLVAQALALLREEGSRRFSVRRVARRADIGLGHLQHYFRPKFRLLQAMADNITFELLYYYEQNIAPLPEPGARLLGVIDFVLSQRCDGEWLVPIREFRTMARDDPTLRELLSSLYQECQRLFQMLFSMLNPALENEQLVAIAKEALALLSDADEFATAGREGSSYRAHLTARILSLVHSHPGALADAALAAPASVQNASQVLNLAGQLIAQPAPEMQIATLCNAAKAILDCDRINLYLGRGGRFRGYYCAGETEDIQRIFHQFVVSANDPQVRAALETRCWQLIHSPVDHTVDPSVPATRAIVAVFDPNGEPCGLLCALFNEPVQMLANPRSTLLSGLASICESILHKEPTLLR